MFEAIKTLMFSLRPPITEKSFIMPKIITKIIYTIKLTNFPIDPVKCFWVGNHIPYMYMHIAFIKCVFMFQIEYWIFSKHLQRQFSDKYSTLIHCTICTELKKSYIQTSRAREKFNFHNWTLLWFSINHRAERKSRKKEDFFFWK